MPGLADDQKRERKAKMRNFFEAKKCELIVVRQTNATIPFLNMEAANDEEIEQLATVRLLMSGRRQSFFDVKYTMKI